MPRKYRSLALTLTLLFAASVASAQFGGQDLPPEAVRGMQANITRHQDMKQMADVTELLKIYDDDELREFVLGSMAKLTLYPDGRFAAYAKPGGEFKEFKLGGKRFTVADQTVREADWLTAEGEFEVPRRSRKVHLTLAARGREVPVDCASMYAPNDEPVTFWVGNLRGMTCLAFSGIESPIALEPVQTAPLMPGAARPGRGN